MRPRPRLKAKVMRARRTRCPDKSGLWGERGPRDPAAAAFAGVPLRVAEGFVDLLERERVGDQPVEWIAAPAPLQKLERPRDHPGIVHDDADDALGPPDERRGVELHAAPPADAADLQV